MNIRKIKIALSVSLLNNGVQPSNALQNIQELMNGYRDEVGGFLSLAQVKNAPLNRNHVQETYAIKFENCTLNVDLITNPATHTKTVQGFQLS